MQRSIPCIRHRPTTTRLSHAPPSSSLASYLLFPLQSRRPPALVYLSSHSKTPDDRASSTSWASLPARPRVKTVRHTAFSVQRCRSSRWRMIGSLGQARSTETTRPSNSLATDPSTEARLGWSLGDTFEAVQLGGLDSWQQLFAAAQAKHGSDGVWDCFELLCLRNQTQVLVEQHAVDLRERILISAVPNDARVALLVAKALTMRQDFDYEWPDLYVQLVYFLLKRKEYERAVMWHLRLFQNFPPGTHGFAGLIASFILDPGKSMQSALNTLYIFSKERQLYDAIIPVLFDNGHSKLARSWRKKLLQFQDFPSSAKALPFLRFLSQYYPSIDLTQEELDVMRQDNASHDSSSTETLRKETYHDNLIAKWFATSWMSVEFAVNLVHGLGVRVIGPRSLQSIALREPDAESVTARLDHLERINMKVSLRTYCKALSFFARHGEDELLTALLHCDVHPQEFDDVETRHMLLTTAMEQKDQARVTLLQGVEWALENATAPHRLNYLLSDMLEQKRLGKAKIILDRMDALQVGMSQENASLLLGRAFWGLGMHPPRWRKKFTRLKARLSLDRAIYISRRVASHNVAIPLRIWKTLLYNLGRSGRFEELRQLSLEIVQRYRPLDGKLISIHMEDLPRQSSKLDRQGTGTSQQKLVDASESWHHRETLGAQDSFWAADFISDPLRPTLWNNHSISDKQHSEPNGKRTELDASKGQLPPATENTYLPADLPFEHLEHPLRKLFDATLQRAVIRWGFDRALWNTPAQYSLNGSGTASLAEADLACGIRLLGSLRDEGVWVDPQLVRSSITTRLALGQLPGRPKNRSRDSNELTARNLKLLADRAWGSELLPSIPDIQQHIERQKPRLWKRYPKLLEKNLDESKIA